MKLIKFLTQRIAIILACSMCAMAHASSDNLILDSTHGGDGSAWGLAQCDACHVMSSIHKDTTAAVRDMTRAKGYASCTGCHGTNGSSLSRPCMICHNENDMAFKSRQNGAKTHNFASAAQKPQLGTALTDTNCLSCHAASNMNGVFESNIDLTLFKDRYGHKSAYANTNEFCLACHNRDHQQPGYEIDYQDYRDPLVAIEDNYRFIDAHGLVNGSGKRTFAGLRDNYSYPAIVACTDCHAMHGTHNEKLIIEQAYNGLSLLDPAIRQKHIPIDSSNGAFAQLCVACHSMDVAEDQADIDTGNGLHGVHQASGSCIECHHHGMAVQTGL